MNAARISKIVKELIKNNEEVNVDNIMTQSLFSTGGTISESEAIQYLKETISIGFCQPKYYKPNVWKESVIIMELLVNKGLVQRFDFGRGKGKYISEISINELVSKF
jgi:hypothetical protein